VQLKEKFVASLAPGDTIPFYGAAARITDIRMRDNQIQYLVESGDARMPMWLPETALHAAHDHSASAFVHHVPHVVAVDNFYSDPDAVRAIALAQNYNEDLRFYKGLRSDQRFLWPHLREEFGRLLGTPVTEWLGHNANGCFQQTSHSDPLVWHHDSQSYAAAVYLTPDAPPSSGTSFWRDRTHGCRRRPDHPLERQRLGTDAAVAAAQSIVYDPYNIEHGDNWELMESIAGLYNRLVIWDAALFHSATSYAHFEADSDIPRRLVQLFFFDI